MDRIKLEEKELEKYFGKDDSDGKTCDCKECNIRNQILSDYKKAIEWDKFTNNSSIEILKTLYDQNEIVNRLRELNEGWAPDPLLAVGQTRIRLLEEYYKKIQKILEPKNES